jgi:hypothetical protein
MFPIEPGEGQHGVGSVYLQKKLREMDRNKHIIENGVWSVIEHPTNYVK